MTFGSTFGRTFSPAFQPKSQAAVDTSWWLAGGISAADCIAAYQPKGAMDYGSSLENLNSPGNFTTKVAGLSDPDWNVTDGWKFDGSTMKLESGVVGGISVIFRFTNAAPTNYFVSACGKRSSVGSQSWNINPNYNGTNCCFNLATTLAYVGGALTSGVVAGVTGVGGYKDGVFSLEVTGTDTSFDGHIGGTGEWSPRFKAIYIQAWAAYSIAISAPQVLAVTTAMNAL